MRNIRSALPEVARAIEGLSGEIGIFSRVLRDTPGFDDIPTSVLTAAYGVIAVAPTVTKQEALVAGDEDRRNYLLDASDFLMRAGYTPETVDVHVALRVWGTTIARVSQCYGAYLVTAQSDDREAPEAARIARSYLRFQERFSLDMCILCRAAASQGEGKYRSVDMAEIRDLVRRAGLKRAKQTRKSSQLSLLVST